MRLTKRAVLSLSAALALAGLAGLAPAASAESGLKATGHGTQTSVNADDGTSGKRQFSFNALLKKDGSVDGHAVLHNPAYEFFATFDVQCMKPLGPNEVTIGALVTKSNDPNLAEGQSAFWTVTDNGEPGTTDTMSGVAFDGVVPPSSCEDVGPDDFAQTPIEGGNIQVKGADEG